MTERGLDTGLPVAGPGAPLISDFAVMELSALLGRSLDSGRNYVGQVVELAHRLPKTWARVLDGQVPVWKALRIADSTRFLPEDAAGFVDGQLAPFAHGVHLGAGRPAGRRPRWSGSTPKLPKNAARPPRTTGTSTSAWTRSATTASLTSPPPSTLPMRSTSENAIARRAKLYGQLGDDDSLDVRRAKALGEIAREDLALDLQVADPETGEITRTIPGRKTELMLHIAATDQTVGRFGNTRTPISVEQIKAWLSLPNTA